MMETMLSPVMGRYLRAAVASRLVLPSLPGALAEVLVAPSSMGSAACPVCGCYQPGSLFEQSVGFKFRCHHCASVSSTSEFYVDLRAGQEMWLDDAVVQAATWYHVSTQADWLANVMAGVDRFGGHPLVHVGPEAAAMDRLRDIGRRAAPKYLFEVRLREGADIAPGFFADADRWPRMSSELAGVSPYPGFSRYGATRYVNHYEASGTISLIVNCAALVLVRRSRVRDNV